MGQIIRCLDSCHVQDTSSNGSKTVYLFLPYYPLGTVQDAINSHAVNGTKYSERVMLSIFLGTCEAVRSLHHYSGPPTTSDYPPSPYPSTTAPYPPSVIATEVQTEEETEEEEHGEEEALIGGLVGLTAAAQEEGLEARAEAAEEASPIGGEGLNRETEGVGERTRESAFQPWAHRDIKPANIMISDNGSPILFDFGSVQPRIPIPNRSIALTQQDLAAEHCSMPFRAPELFDVGPFELETRKLC